MHTTRNLQTSLAHHFTASDMSCPTTITPPALKHTCIQTHKYTIQVGSMLNVKARVQIKPRQIRKSEAACLILASRHALTSEAIQSVCWMHNKAGAKTEREELATDGHHFIYALLLQQGRLLFAYLDSAYPGLFSGILPLTPRSKWHFVDSSQWLKVFKTCGDQPERRTREAKLWVNTHALRLFKMPDFKLSWCHCLAI